MLEHRAGIGASEGDAARLDLRGRAVAWGVNLGNDLVGARGGRAPPYCAGPEANRYVGRMSDAEQPQGEAETLERLEAPFRSEQAMFKVFVAVALAAAPVIAAGLIISPLAGVIVLLFELGLGVGVWLSRRR